MKIDYGLGKSGVVERVRLRGSGSWDPTKVLSIDVAEVESRRKPPKREEREREEDEEVEE